MKISFTVPGKPIPQARPRVTQNGRHTYTPRRSVVYREAVALCAQSAMRGKKPLSGALHVRVQFLFRVPSSWRKTDRDEAERGEKSFTSRPDLDNLYKAVTDAMNGIVYKDDAQIVHATVRKGYAIGRPEGAYVEVENAETAQRHETADGTENVAQSTDRRTDFSPNWAENGMAFIKAGFEIERRAKEKRRFRRTHDDNDRS